MPNKRHREKVQLWPTPSLREMIASRGEDCSVTGTVTTAVDRYLEMCARHLPCLEEQEWMAVLDALNGWGSTPAGIVQHLPMQVADAIAIDGLADKWGLADSGRVLQEELDGMCYAGLAAVTEVAERFWADRSDELAKDTLALVLESVRNRATP